MDMEELLTILESATDDQLMQFGRLYERGRNAEQQRLEKLGQIEKAKTEKEFLSYWEMNIRHLMKNKKFDLITRQKIMIAEDVNTLLAVANTEPNRQFAHLLYAKAREMNEEFKEIKIKIAEEKRQKRIAERSE